MEVKGNARNIEKESYRQCGRFKLVKNNINTNFSSQIGFILWLNRIIVNF